ncbi:hypothetical protein AHAS_Ahas13G0230500 [Arachis hypogaea]
MATAITHGVGPLPPHWRLGICSNPPSLLRIVYARLRSCHVLLPSHILSGIVPLSKAPLLQFQRIRPSFAPVPLFSSLLCSSPTLLQFYLVQLSIALRHLCALEGEKIHYSSSSKEDAVTKGTHTGVFTSWEDAREQVCDFIFPEVHGFNSYQQVVLAFNARLWCITIEKCATLQMMGSSVIPFLNLLEVRCENIPVVKTRLPVIGEFSIVNSMEEWLVKLCYDSEIPASCFFKKERYLRNQGPFYGFTVVVPGEPYEFKLNAKGQISMVEKATRKDAAMEMLGQVLDITSKAIKDYNYSKVELLRDSNNVLQAKVGQLEDDHKKLKASYDAAVNARIEGQSP